LNFSDARLDFPQPGAHRLNDPWIVCRVFLLHLSEHLNRLGCEELHATQWVETHKLASPFSLTVDPKTPDVSVDAGPANDCFVS